MADGSHVDVTTANRDDIASLHSVAQLLDPSLRWRRIDPLHTKFDRRMMREENHRAGAGAIELSPEPGGAALTECATLPTFGARIEKDQTESGLCQRRLYEAIVGEAPGKDTLQMVAPVVVTHH